MPSRLYKDDVLIEVDGVSGMPPEVGSGAWLTLLQPRTRRPLAERSSALGTCSEILILTMLQSYP